MVCAPPPTKIKARKLLPLTFVGILCYHLFIAVYLESKRPIWRARDLILMYR